MVIMGMGDHNPPNLRFLILKVANIRNNQVNPRHPLIRKPHPTINDYNIILILINKTVFLYQPNSPQWDQPKGIPTLSPKPQKVLPISLILPSLFHHPLSSNWSNPSFLVLWFVMQF